MKTMILMKWIKKVLGINTFSVKAQQLPQMEEKSIKLSVITQFFPPDYAATGQLIEELVRNLEKQGVDIDVFTGQPGYAFNTSKAPVIERKGQLRIKRSRVSQIWPQRIRGKAINGVIFTLRSALHLIRHFRKRKVLLLTTAPPFLPILGYAANRFFGLSYICIVYDLYPDIAIALGVLPKNHLIAKIWQKLNRLIWQKAKGIVVLSPEMRQRVAAICPEATHKISVIHNWADPNLIIPISKSENWFAWKHNLVPKFTVLYSGNMGRCHDMDTILRAAELLKDEPIQFTFVGGGPKRPEFIKKVNELGLKNCIFLPYVDKQELCYSLTACDLSLVTIDTGFESLVAPSKLYSALAAGRPIAAICPNGSYLKQLVTDAHCGTVVENGDSQRLAEFIRKLSQDSQLTNNLGIAARQYLQSNFTPVLISKQYLNLLARDTK